MAQLKITVVAATTLELKPLFELYQPAATAIQGLYTVSEHLHFLITGMGMLNTAAHLSLYAAAHDRDLYIDAGVCGAFNRELKISEVVFVDSETYGDFGVENDDQFEDFFDLGFLDQKEDAFQYGLCQPLYHPIQEKLSLKKVSSVTVNKVHGQEATIKAIQKKYKADTENMEGLAFYYVLKLLGKPGIEVRAISNYVEKRNKDNWDLKSAISKLNAVLDKLINAIA